MATNDLKPKGGRGKRAEYRTVQVRCPEPIKQAVTELINRWHLGETEQPEQSQDDSQLTELRAEIEQLKQLNINLNTTINELRKQNQELDTENLKLHEKTGDLALEVDSLKAEVKGNKINPNTSISSDIVPILENALTLKPNAGGKIKEAIREALKLLQ